MDLVCNELAATYALFAIARPWFEHLAICLAYASLLYDCIRDDNVDREIQRRKHQPVVCSQYSIRWLMLILLMMLKLLLTHRLFVLIARVEWIRVVLKSIYNTMEQIQLIYWIFAPLWQIYFDLCVKSYFFYFYKVKIRKF